MPVAANITRFTWAHSTCRKTLHELKPLRKQKIANKPVCTANREREEKNSWKKGTSSFEHTLPGSHMPWIKWNEKYRAISRHFTSRCMFFPVYLPIVDAIVVFCVRVPFRCIRFQNCFELDQIFYSASTIHHSERQSFSHLHWFVDGAAVRSAWHKQMHWHILPNHLDDTSVNSTHSTHSCISFDYSAQYACNTQSQWGEGKKRSRQKKMMCYNWTSNGNALCLIYETWWNVTTQMKNHYIKLSA